MEQVLKKPFWKRFAQVRRRSWRQSIRLPLMLAASGSVLVALLVMVFGVYFWAAGSALPTNLGLLLIFLAGGALLLWVICTLVMYACLDRFLLRRIETMRESAGRVSRGDFQHRVTIDQTDELGLLAEQINLLAGGLGKHEAALARANAKVMADSQFKSDMLARVSHDLRQPLGVILGFSEMIRDEVIGPVTNPQRRAVNEIILSTARLSQLVTDLLDSSRMESHNLSLRIDDFSPALLLRQLYDQVSLPAKQKGLALTTELDPALPPTLRGDPKRLLLVLHNLAVNAIKFTQQGSVHVRIFQSGADHWAFSVADTGQGIPDGDLVHLFEPFWQSSDPTTRDRGGIGLGLSIAQQLVQLMDGHIQVESTVGVGSTFLVTLPLDLSLERGE